MLTVPPNLIFKVLGRVSSPRANLRLSCTKFSEVFGREGLFKGARCLQSYFILYLLGHNQILKGIFRREEFSTGVPCLHSDIMWNALGRYLLLPVLTTNTVGNALEGPVLTTNMVQNIFLEGPVLTTNTVQQHDLEGLVLTTNTVQYINILWQYRRFRLISG